MKSVKIVLASLICAVLALTAISLPSGGMSSAFAIGTLGSPLPSPTGNTCISRSVVNIRKAPSARTRIVGRLPRNGSFTITARNGRWVQGSSKWGSGWVMAALLRCAR